MGSAERTLTVTLTRQKGHDAATLPRLSWVLEQPKHRPAEKRMGLQALVVGSHPDCDLVCRDGRVSREHCRLQLTAEGVVVTDLNSKNGLYLHGARVREVVLTQPAELQLGGCLLRLVVHRGEDEVPLATSSRFGDALGASVTMRAVFALLARAAQAELAVLLHGESGTGKELLARGVHAHSVHAEGAFVVVDCSALSEELSDAELFGHEPGAFTGAQRSHVGLFEQAHGATLFLDSVDELSPALQPKLLRVLEAGTVRPLGATEDRPARFRLIASSRVPLEGLVREGQFREELLFRLSGVELRVPPLRERREDVPLLVEHVLRQMDPPRRLSDLPSNSLELLLGHAWPGNVRELRNTVTRWVLFPELAGASAPGYKSSASRAPWGHLPWREARDAALESFERTYVERKVDEAGGNVSQAAKDMGVSRQFLYRLLSRHGVKGAE